MLIVILFAERGSCAGTSNEQGPAFENLSDILSPGFALAGSLTVKRLCVGFRPADDMVRHSCC